MFETSKVDWSKILTVTSFTPAALAPRQRPVDIPPQPEYRSNRDSSSFLDLQVLKVGFSEGFIWIPLKESGPKHLEKTSLFSLNSPEFNKENKY